MYSGSTLTALSGRILGTHQKIDRIARRNVERLLPGNALPVISQILHFEGDNGPDAIKRKSPAKDEPWHFLQPYDEKDTQLIDFISEHYRQLVHALKSGNEVRAAFEAAWLSHAMIDGLTPAHHYPYEAELSELRNGEGIETRTTLKGRLVMGGEKASGQMKNNWKMWGPKGLFTTHAAFEGGVATLIAPLRLVQGFPSQAQIIELTQNGLPAWFRIQAQRIADWNLYSQFYESGWTTTLARRIRSELAPLLVQVVTTVWYMAVTEAQADK